ncbi:MAG: pyruvate dehydrogenase (acetyl-transferring), homodimeric type, partial [Candidatus Binatia bacterium]
EVLAAAEMLQRDYGVGADVYSITSFSELRRQALEGERWNLLHPAEKPRSAYVSDLLGAAQAPVVAATDYMRSVPDQIRQWVPGPYVTLGTDGFGRSDGRAALRHHFEVDRAFIVLATLKALAAEGAVDAAVVAAAVEKLGIDADKPDPMTT